MKQIISIKWSEITLYSNNKDDFISLTDIARFKNQAFPKDVVKNWMRNYNTVEYLWLWERLNNPNFNGVNFDPIEKQAWKNAFVLSPSKWIEEVWAIWMIVKRWKEWWIYAHKDIAFKFASWISVEFELYLIIEFQRLKESETKINTLEWSVKRELTKINYKLQTDSIKNYLIPSIEDFKKKYIYADEADLLNVIIFQKTAKDWREENDDKPKNENIRDYATIEQLLLLANLENLNWEFIKQWLELEKRYELLSEIAKNQMRILFGSSGNFKKLM